MRMAMSTRCIPCGDSDPRGSLSRGRTPTTRNSWYVEQRWTQILDEILARVYRMRCQLAYGAATYGGRLNRTSLMYCVTMMQRLLPRCWACGSTTAPTKTGADVLSADGRVAGAGVRRQWKHEEPTITFGSLEGGVPHEPPFRVK